MGQGTAGVDATQKSPREIERELAFLRTRLDRSLAELDRRRHELTNVKLQARRHPLAFAGAGGALLLIAGGVGFAIWRAARKPSLPTPELLRREHPALQKILAAVGTTIAVGLTRKLLARAWTDTTYTIHR